MTKLLLTRHGETVANAAQVLQGQRPGELDEKGREQARAVGQRLRGEHIDVFVASDLKRAVDTCHLIMEAWSGKDGAAAEAQCGEVVTTPLLRERDWGSFTGKYIPDLQDQEWPDDIESIPRLKSRAQNFLTWVKVTWPGKTVLAVGHGIINKAVQSVYYHKPMNEIPKMGNAEVRVLEL